MFIEERHKLILEILHEKKRVEVEELTEALGVSVSTIRRDLHHMEQRSLLTRTHGGAMEKVKTNEEISFKEKADDKKTQKTEIGKKAADLIEDSDTIILDSGTTTIEIAKNIKAQNITVITNSIDIASILSYREDIELILSGGTLRSTTRALVGNISEMVIKNFIVDKAFIGANGISISRGITTPNFIEAQCKKAMINSANKVIVSTDSTKFNKSSFSVICSIEEVDVIVTSGDMNNKLLEEFNEKGIQIIK